MFFFFFNYTSTTEIYTLSLHDALPIWVRQLAPPAHQRQRPARRGPLPARRGRRLAPRLVGHRADPARPADRRSEEHTSELQSRQYLVCRLLLEKKKKQRIAVIEFAYQM